MKDQEDIQLDIVENVDSHNDSKNKHILLTVLKRHKIGLLVIILLAMVSSTFAWFIYNRTVDLTLNAHVKTWNIELGESDDEVDVYEIKIEALYPGMATINTSTAGGGIPIHNAGEVAATISINITSITLFGEEQVVNEDYVLEKSEDGKTFTVTGYPFVLKFVLDASELGIGAVSALNYTLEWDYENDDPACLQEQNGETVNICDMLDTEMGEASYEFSEANKDANPKPSSLVIAMKMDVTQKN